MVLVRERPGGQRSVGPHSCVFVRTVVVNVNVIGVDAVSDGDGWVVDDFARASDVLVGQDAAVAFPRPGLHHLPHREVRREGRDVQRSLAVQRVRAVLADPPNDRGALVRSSRRYHQRRFRHQALGDGAEQRIRGTGVVKVGR